MYALQVVSHLASESSIVNYLLNMVANSVANDFQCIFMTLLLSNLFVSSLLKMFITLIKVQDNQVLD